MNGLSFSELCFLFCCPPCPGNIAAKVAFQPPEPSYVFVPLREKLPTKSVSPSTSSGSESQPTAGSSAADTEPSTIDLAEQNKPTLANGNLSHHSAPTPAVSLVAANILETTSPALVEVNGLGKSNEARCGSVFAACRRPISSDHFAPARMELSERAEWQYTQRELRQFEAGWTRSARGNRIACVYVRAVAQPKYVILFSHGNAVDLGHMSSFYLGLGTKINCDVFG